MISFNDGGAAFPGAGNAGMSLRDYFAGQVIAGMMANHERLMIIVEEFDTQEDAEKKIAEAAYKTADAMLAARKEHK